MDVLQRKSASKDKGQRDPAGGEQSNPNDTEPQTADQEFEVPGDMWEQLGELRLAASVAQAGSKAFVWSVLGGQWTASHKGVAHGAFKGRSTAADAKRWAQSHSLTPSASFSVKMYGEQSAQLLAEAWTGRVNKFFQISGGGLKGTFSFSDVHLASVGNSEEFELARAGAKGAARSRFDAVARLSPA